MDFYLNHVCLIKYLKDDQKLEELNFCIKELTLYQSRVGESHGKVLVDEKLLYCLYSRNNPYLYHELAMCLVNCPCIPAEPAVYLGISDVEPSIRSEEIREIIGYCCRDGQEHMLSHSLDAEIQADTYEVIHQPVRRIKSIKGYSQLDQYLVCNPIPVSMKEVMKKASEDNCDLVFTDKAVDTAEKRNSAYRTFGYDKILRALSGIQRMLIPFYKGQNTGKSEQMIFDEFKLAYGIEISDETKNTMNMFGHLRGPFTYNQ